MAANQAGISVLHVDDEPDFGDMAAEFIERQDERITVETASSASEGNNRLSENRFDCVVSDYDMPEQNGIEFLEAVREDYPELPFILYTGKGSEEVASEAISAGVTDYLQKGTGQSQYEVLVNRIQNAVEKRRARQEVAQTEERLRTIARNTNDIIWKFNDDWSELRFINAAYEEIWGRSVEELQAQPKSFLDGIHPEDRDLVLDAMGRLSAGESVDIEYRVNVDEDFGRWVWVQGEPLVDGDGEVESVVGFARDITERKRQAERYEALIEHSMDVITVIDDSGTITYESPSVKHILGYEPEQLIGETAFEYVHPDDRDRIDTLFSDLIDQPESGIERATYRYEHADGHWVWLESVGRVDSDSPIDGFVFNSRDVSERVEREQKLEQAVSRYSALLENANDAICRVEYDGDTPIIREANPEFESIFVPPGTDVVGRNLDEVVASAQRRDEAREISRRVRNGEVVSSELKRDTVEGPKDFHWQVIPISQTKSGQAESTFVIYTDISERIAHEAELERYEILVEVAGDPMYMLDPEGHFRYVNEALVEIAGYAKEELIGAHVEKVMNKEDIESGEELIESLLSAGGRRGTFEMEFSPKEGESIPAENHISLIYDDGELRGTVGVLRDISARLERERRLQRERDRLDEFAGVLSHDLRNPLNVAQGRLELAQDECESDHLDAVVRAQNRMEQLINDVLSMARAGDAIGESEIVELSLLAETCWRNVDTDSAELVVESDVTIQADETRLQQLIENLFRNAVEHGEGDVVIRIGEVPSGFYVEDDGPGIPEDNRSKVLDPGYSTSKSGTGFGLSIVRDIADAHGWTINLTSGEAGGARFEFRGVQSS